MAKTNKERILMGLKPPRWVKCEIYPNCKSCLNYKRACIFRYKDIDDDNRMLGLRNETCNKTLEQIKTNLGRLKKKDKKKYIDDKGFIKNRDVTDIDKGDFE